MPHRHDWKCERIYVVDFPAAVEPESLHVNASRGLQCNAVSKISCRVSGDFSELEDAEQRLDQLKGEYLFLQKKKEGLFKYLSESCGQRLRMEELEETYQQTDKKNEELIHEEQQLKEKILQLNEEIKKQKKQKDKVFTGLELEVCADEQKEYILSVVYNTESAYWKPVYDIQSFSRSNQVSFSLKAKIFQNMEVDWTNIYLTFSTGTKNNINVTDFHSYKIVKKHEMMDLPLPLAQLSPDGTDDFDEIGQTLWSDEMENPKERFERNSPVRNAEKGNLHKEFSGSLKREFVMKKLYTIRAGSQISLVINCVNKEIKKIFFAVPEKERHEYMGFHVKELLGMNLLSCNANIFLDGTYIGNKKMDPEKSEGLFVLGQVKGVYVTKKLASDETAFITNGMAAGMTKVRRGYRITVKNELETQAMLQIIDQIPVTDEPDVKIQDIRLEGAQVDEKTGYCYWNIVLNPKQEIVLPMEYTICLPCGEEYDY